MGALVMFMAPGFAMLEAGMVEQKSTSEILETSRYSDSLRNVPANRVQLCTTLRGYRVPHGRSENTVAEVLESKGDVYYSARSDFFFQVVFMCSHGDVDYIRCGC